MHFLVLESESVLTPALTCELHAARRQLDEVSPATRALEFQVTQARGLSELLRESEKPSAHDLVFVITLATDAEEGLNLLRQRRVVDTVYATFAVGTATSPDVEWLLHDAGVTACHFGSTAAAAGELARWWMRLVLLKNASRRTATSADR